MDITFPVGQGQYVYTAPFGELRPGGRHMGTDIASKPTGAMIPLCATVDGVISGTGFEAGGAGNWLWLAAGNDITYKYFHMSSYAVRQGDRVSAGQQIGNMGTTGNSTGVHLHLERHVGGLSNPTDPTPELVAAEAAGRFPGAVPLAATTQPITTLDSLETVMIRNDIDGSMYLLGIVDNRPHWIRLEQPDQDALLRLGVGTLESVGHGNDARDADFHRFE